MQTGEMGFSLEMNSLRQGSRRLSSPPDLSCRRWTTLTRIFKKYFLRLPLSSFVHVQKMPQTTFPNNPQESARRVTALAEDLSLLRNNEKTSKHPFQHSLVSLKSTFTQQTELLKEFVNANQLIDAKFRKHLQVAAFADRFHSFKG